MIPSLTGSLTDGLCILWFNVMSESMVPSLTDTKTDCLLGEVGYIACVLNQKKKKKSVVAHQPYWH